MQRALLIINRAARSGSASLQAGIERLKAQGIELITHHPEAAATVGHLIHQHRTEVDAVIIGGGDGTLNCAAAALIEAGLPLGILPLGTANDLARTLGIPPDVEQACAVIARGHTRRIDLGRVNGVYFFNAASIGLGVNVTRRLTREIKRRWGVLAYARTVYDELRGMRAFHAEITCDGEHHRIRTMHIGVGSGRYYGGGMTVSEDAAIDDARLDLYSIRPQNFWRLLTLAPALRDGRLAGREDVYVLRGRSIEIRTSRPFGVSTDGEITTHTPAYFYVVSQAVTVFIPESGETQGGV